MKVYILIASSGDYEDYRSWVEAVYAKEENALIAWKTYNDFIKANTVRYTPEQKAAFEKIEDDLFDSGIYDSDLFPPKLKEYTEWRDRNMYHYYPAQIKEFDLL